MTGDDILEARLREALARDLSEVTPRLGGEGRLYREMDGTRLRLPRLNRTVHALIVPAAVALAIAALVLAIPMVLGVGRGSVQPAGRPTPTAVCPTVQAGEDATLTPAGSESAELLDEGTERRSKGVPASDATEDLATPEESVPAEDSSCVGEVGFTLDPGSGTVWSWLLRGRTP
ncbi:hypothetical protein [Kineosporia sp. NBRC 101731]|uniref:hypothetical protein n=1 Tax=Kineosporia sp. NBRC 101731 TaxID=3032199 RepID=UPI0024A2587A|nr:hypothetical protein [Kineosporia sp. NBRC 101731]GLY28794.1 hypothetical protein Kisp02_21590 [Kineosporia sp. NBRC 101731]